MRLWYLPERPSVIFEWKNGRGVRYDDPPKDPNKVVTQGELDRIYKMYKEGQEKLEVIIGKLDKSEKEKVEIIGKIAEMERRNPPPAKPKEEEEVEYSEQNPPQTEAEWDEFFYAHPAAASDLRNRLSSKFRDAEDNWKKRNKECIEELVTLHPDMYKKDDKGNILKNKDGAYVIDETSDKGKIFIDIAGSDPAILHSATAPRIVREAMEKRLKDKQEDTVKKGLEEKKKKEEEDREKKVKAGQIAGGGNNPPPPPGDDGIKVEYTSEEEKTWVAKGIKEGRFKDEKHYMRVKTSQTIGYGRGGF